MWIRQLLVALFVAQLSATLPTVFAGPLAEQPDPAASVEAQGATAEPVVESATPVDVMTVLDNSGSMRTNDPQFLTREVVSAFAARLAPNSRLGVILFDEKVNIALGLTDAGAPGFKEQVARSLKRVDYRGQRTDIPAGVERAMYELRAHERPKAQHIIIFLTDGIVDVGSSAKDLERARWLREDLAQEAKRLGIRIFGIALTEAADFQLIQSVAQTTGGEYFRVLAASDIPDMFERISARIEEMIRPAQPVAEAKQVETTAPQVPAPLVQPAPVVVQVPVPTSDWQPWLLSVISFVVLGIVGVVALLVLRRPAPKMPAVTLYDRSGQSGKNEYPIKKRVTRIGRDVINDVVIPQGTMSSQHAVIEFRDGVFYLCDLRSLNGTYRNGEKFSDRETIREVVLRNRDRIRFDAYEFEFIFDALKNAQQTVLAGTVPASGTHVRVEPPGIPIQATEPPAASTQAPEAPSPQLEEAEAAAPTPVEAAPAPGNGPAPTLVKNEQCQRHPSWKATELCMTCGRAWCEYCINEKDGKVVCVECFAKAA